MYLITTLVAGLQLTVDIFRMRRPNTLTRVTGAAMLVDATNLLIPLTVIIFNGHMNDNPWPLIARMLDYVVMLLLLCIGDVLVHDRLSPRKVIIASLVILPTTAAYTVWGEIVLDLVIVPVFLLVTYAIFVNCRRILKYDKNLAYLYSNTENRSKQWYIWVCASLMLEMLFWIWAYITKEYSIVPKMVYYVFMTCFWLFLFRFATVQKATSIDTESITNFDIEEEVPDEAQATNETEENKGESKSELLMKMEELMNEKKLYLNSDLTLMALAEQLGSNRTYVSHVFNHELNVTFYQYVNKLRIEYACKRIVESDEKLSSIAYESGFSTPANMVRIMREYTGMTPSQIRANGGGKIHCSET